MRNILNRSVEKMKKTFYVQKLSSENHTVYEIMSKHVVEPEEPKVTSQYDAYALRARLARLYARMRMHTPTRPRTHMHARASMHTQTNM
jgi:hypothetical protein